MGIRYKEKRVYKYILVERAEFETGISVSVPVYLGPLTVRADGTLVIDRGYAWDAHNRH